jgi:predicted RNA-binding Zn-ribbon protein involved in translation (DUF1610 family)
MANSSLSDRLGQFLRGRNGSDELGNCCVFLGLLVLLVNVFVRAWWMAAIALVPVLYALWRMLSTNLAARRRENNAFLRSLGPVAHWVHDPRATFTERRTYKHLTCPSCGNEMRVPRGKGKLRVTCPHCGEKFETRS